MRKGSVRAASVVAALAWAASTGSAGAAGKVTLKGSHPAWAQSKHFVGAADTSGAVDFRVYLGWKDAAGAEALANAVSDPRSASYRQFLSPAQFRDRFAPSEAKVADVRSWLKQQGFAVTYTPSNRHYVAAEGTVAQASAAFGTSFGTYAVDGKSVRSPSGDVSIPDSLAGAVAERRRARRQRGVRHARPCGRHEGAAVGGLPQRPAAVGLLGTAVLAVRVPGRVRRSKLPSVPWTVKGYTPAQIKGAYNISGAYDGSGQTVAVVDAYASPTILQDVNQWSRNRGLPTMNPSQFEQVVAPGTYKRPQNTHRIRRAGTARRRSTSRPCTAWRRARTSSTSARRTTTRTSTRR